MALGHQQLALQEPAFKLLHPSVRFRQLPAQCLYLLLRLGLPLLHLGCQEALRLVHAANPVVNLLHGEILQTHNAGQLCNVRLTFLVERFTPVRR